jgi:hypothetical protein
VRIALGHAASLAGCSAAPDEALPGGRPASA